MWEARLLRFPRREGKLLLLFLSPAFPAHAFMTPGVVLAAVPAPGPGVGDCRSEQSESWRNISDSNGHRSFPVQPPHLPRSRSKKYADASSSTRPAFARVA